MSHEYKLLLELTCDSCEAIAQFKNLESATGWTEVTIQLSNRPGGETVGAHLCPICSRHPDIAKIKAIAKLGKEPQR